MKKIILALALIAITQNAHAEEYSLSRFVMAFNDGNTLDSLAGQIDVFGSMSINSGFVTQDVTVCTERECIDGFGVNGQINKFGPNNAFVKISSPGNGNIKITVLSTYPNLVTMTNLPTGDALIKTWELVQ